MSTDEKARAEARLEAALAEAAVRDPRPFYRRILKYLKERDPAAFAAASRHFQEELVPAVAGAADPLEAWLAYGRRLGEALGAGRTVAIDDTGRVRTGGEGDLVLRIPDATDVPVLVLRCPRRPSRAQGATVELLAEGRVTASAYGEG